MNFRSAKFFPALLGGVFLASCVTKPPPPPPKPTPAPERHSYWKGDHVEGAPLIKINLAEQWAYFYKGDKLVGESRISSGKKEFETPPGRYKVIQKDKDHVSNLYGDYVSIETGEIVKKNVDTSKDPMPEGTEFKGAKMPYFLRFTKGYGMHAGYVPRYRASHGCVRMPAEMAQHFFENATEGTPVIVVEGDEEPQKAQEKKSKSGWSLFGENKRGTSRVPASR